MGSSLFGTGSIEAVQNPAWGEREDAQ